MKYTYTAIIHKDKDRKGDYYWAEFPDFMEIIGNCTDGRTWKEILFMCDDLLNLMCLECEESGISFPIPSKDFVIKPEDIVYDFTADTEKYAKVLKQAEKIRRFRLLDKARRKYWFK